MLQIDPIMGPASEVDSSMVKSTNMDMKAEKAAGTSGTVVEMLKIYGEVGHILNICIFSHIVQGGVVHND
uniref:Uncharacterized protein n=1 Tax=Octopus bimaculoides TaxID=37653 RepID=A0A0L8FRN5_OCTBM